MNTLFAPWRMEFIENHAAKKTCPLCDIQNLESEQSLIVHKGNVLYVVMNKYPYAHGHLMIVPKRHEADWTKLTKDELIEMGELTQKCIRNFRKAFNAESFNIGVNLGKPAGAGIEGHVHQHIVPRWTGDFNFMPLFSETKVISEHLNATYHRLIESWQNS